MTHPARSEEAVAAQKAQAQCRDDYRRQRKKNAEAIGVVAESSKKAARY
jgi:hypothetical protein